MLWRAIDALFSSGRRIHIVIYTCDTDKSPQEILGKARRMFQLELKRGDEISFVYITSYYLLEPGMYPVTTILGQSLGSMLVACECLVRATPDMFFDSTGFAFTMGIAKLLGACYTAAYVHYPTISTGINIYDLNLMREHSWNECTTTFVRDAFSLLLLRTQPNCWYRYASEGCGWNC